MTGHEDPTKDRSDVDWAALARTGGTLVVYMGVGRLEEIVSALTGGGLPADTPAAVVRRATTPEQHTVNAPLGRIAEAAREKGLAPPALVVIGEVARPERRAAWFEALPLFGRKIVVTRSRKPGLRSRPPSLQLRRPTVALAKVGRSRFGGVGQASVLVRELRLLGADVLELPTIEILSPEDTGPLDAALRALETYDYVIFTSANAVESVRGRLFELGLDLRNFRNARVAAIGEATAARLLDIGLRADVVAEKFTAEGLLDALSSEDVSGKRVLLPRAKEAREVLPEGLRDRGATVDVVEAYRTVRPAIEGAARRAFDALVKGEVDLLTFTSSSTVTNLAELVGPDKLKAILEVPAAAIGPVTAKTARELGFSVVVQPESYTIPALVEAVQEHFKEQAPRPAQEEVGA